ncbi:DUF4259 domain-containing protein [Corynebacterium lubricantis]|uniref:DUF4259 domain-containing protein n=1 Tax=Corynebacterium lubricantis TaxID=541095 RepID=UPI00037A04A8|nr:DUF4259 domain-containing protein [Corynebacterium lubricantis]
MSETNQQTETTANTGPFDNNEARELIADLQKGGLPVRELLPNRGHKHLSTDEGELIVALAAMATGNKPEGIPDETIAELNEPDVRNNLRESLDAVLMDATVSDLYGQWESRGQAELNEWKARSWVDLS